MSNAKQTSRDRDQQADRWRLEYWPLDRLIPSPRNARTHSDAQVAEIAGSIRAFGFANPILVGDGGDIVAGHGRLAAARQLGLAEVPVIQVKGLSELQRRQLVLADNRIALNASWDADMLRLELQDLSAMGADLSVLGFTAQELEVALAPDGSAGLTDENEIPSIAEKPVSKAGDIWCFGPHRIACGDSTDPADWAPAWALFPGNIAYVWHGALHAGTVAESLERHGFSIRAQIIWAKERLVIGRGDYHWMHEPCWYAVRTKGQWTGDRKQTTLWTIPNGGQDSETVHSTQKPVECMRRPLLNNSSAGQVVYDPFLGSGTTLIAAETVDRACLGIELEPLYVDVAVRRWQAFAGGAATLEADGQTFNSVEAERCDPPATTDAALSKPTRSRRRST